MNPHLETRVLEAGPAARPGRPLALLVHGRNQEPEFMLELAGRLGLQLPLRALTAADRSWYPGSFLAPLLDNQPRLDQALERLEHFVASLEGRGWDRRELVLIGFSQGACLLSEYLYRHPGRWAAAALFTGGLIGPPGTEWKSTGSLSGTPALLSTSRYDTWVPVARTEESALVFERLHAEVQLEITEDREHHVSEAQVKTARAFLHAAGVPCAPS